ncbi:MAG: branched-chain amino acid aminotransferase [Flavobacteriales bacterium]
MISEETKDFPVTKTDHSRLNEIDMNDIPFGKVFTDHMFIMEHQNGKWSDPRIEPFQKLELMPSTSVLHYGQGIFEGLKAHLDYNDNIILFRPDQNIKRMNKSAERMCMPQIDENVFLHALKQLVELEKEWIPKKEGCSLYIRPFMIGTDEFIGVKPSDTYKFIIFTSPTMNYYTKPVNVKIETKYSRACEGGVGAAKAAGNYAASLYPAKKASQEGYDQLIWTDAKEHKYVEESGTMNLMFQIEDKLVTSPLTDSILPGVTRDSVIKLARDKGIKVEERQISIKEVIDGIQSGIIKDAFGTGTAATIIHIEKIGYKGEQYQLPPVSEREYSGKLKDELEALKRGRVEDKYGWLYKV